MADDEAIALYGAVKRMAEAMAAREAVLDAKTAALDHAIAELKGLPLALGKQTSQYIAMGVRQSIQDDFSRPIETAVKGPLELLNREIYHARDVMAQVGNEVAFQTWRWVAFLVLIGVAIGSGGCYWFFVRDLNQVNERLDSIQQQVMVVAPLPDAKPAIGSPTRAHHSSHPAIAPSAP
jgi:hypothetical protein